MEDKKPKGSSLREALQKRHRPSDAHANGHTDGCIILGKNPDSHEKYVTRYYIDHALQHRKMSKQVMNEECIPCCEEGNRHSARSCVWNFVEIGAFFHIIQL